MNLEEKIATFIDDRKKVFLIILFCRRTTSFPQDFFESDGKI
jgi:hypothetical protein